MFDHSLTVWSDDAEAKRKPFGAIDMSFTREVWPVPIDGRVFNEVKSQTITRLSNDEDISCLLFELKAIALIVSV